MYAVQPLRSASTVGTSGCVWFCFWRENNLGGAETIHTVCIAHWGLGLGGWAGSQFKDVRRSCAPESHSPKISFVVKVTTI